VDCRITAARRDYSITDQPEVKLQHEQRGQALHPTFDVTPLLRLVSKAVGLRYSSNKNQGADPDNAIFVLSKNEKKSFKQV
jgi:hypothetical protein